MRFFAFYDDFYQELGMNVNYDDGYYGWGRKTFMFDSKFRGEVELENSSLKGPEYVSSMKDFVCYFIEGNMYIHGAGNYNYFFDDQKKIKFKFVANKAPLQNKVLDSISYTCSEKLENDDYLVEVTTQSTSGYPHGQTTKLHSNNFIQYENRYEAAFLRNGTTKSPVFSVKDLITGDKMRHNWFWIKFEIDVTGELTLESINVNLLPSI
jgi:hypothetical protein